MNTAARKIQLASRIATILQTVKTRQQCDKDMSVRAKEGRDANDTRGFRGDHEDQGHCQNDPTRMNTAPVEENSLNKEL